MLMATTAQLKYDPQAPRFYWVFSASRRLRSITFALHPRCWSWELPGFASRVLSKTGCHWSMMTIATKPAEVGTPFTNPDCEPILIVKASG